MKLLKIQKTSKLFFDKYVNKVAIDVPLATLFRSRDLDSVKLSIDEYFKKLDASPDGYIEVLNRWARRKYYPVDIFQAYIIRDALAEESDYALRIEGKTLGIYSNNDHFIEFLAHLNPSKTESLSTPGNRDAKEYLLKNANTVFVKKKTHEYKLKLHPLFDLSEPFLEWAGRQPGVKIFSKPSVYARSNGLVYALNDKTLTLCKLYLGNKISRIDRLIEATDLQK